MKKVLLLVGIIFVAFVASGCEKADYQQFRSGIGLLFDRRRIYLDFGWGAVQFGESASQQRRLTPADACNWCITLRGGMKNV